jgi:putative PIN family toxin of toxin-antitoxin system
MQKSTQPVQKEEPEENPDKPKVVLDTNILVSALISSKGTSARILSLVLEGRLQFCYNQEIMDEYETVLSRSKFKSDFTLEQRQSVVDALKKKGLSCDVVASVLRMEDESDRPFYDVAKHAGAFLITNNTKHFPKDPLIFTPGDFAETFNDPPRKADIFLARQYLRRHSGR